MDHISGFFSRYLSPYFKQERIKDAAAKVCSDVLGITILPTQITIRAGVCTVSGHQSIKHQLFLHQGEILRRFSEIKDLSKISSVH